MDKNFKTALILICCLAVCLLVAFGIREAHSGTDMTAITESEDENENNPVFDEPDTSIQIRRIDLRIKDYVFDRMSRFTENGYSIVMNNETGKILALASIRDGKYEFYNLKSHTDGTLEMPSVTGSALKLLYSVPVVECGLDEKMFVDEGYTELKTGEVISNAGRTAFGLTDIESALTNKSNVWFAKVFDRAEEDRLNDFNSRLLSCNSSDLGFATVKAVRDESVNPVITASTGKGLDINPIYMCALLSGLSNGTGKVMKPFIDDSEPSVLLEFTDSGTASKLCSYFKNCGRRHDMEDTCFTIHYSESPEAGYICYCADENYTILCCTDCGNSMTLEDAAYDILLRLKYT